jgi:hypothetical protein
MDASSRVLALIIVLTLAPRCLWAQSPDDTLAWRTVAAGLEAGIIVDVRLRSGRHFKATFVEAHQNTMLVQRRTRIPVSVEEIPYDAIASLSRVPPAQLTAGKIAGIALGVAGAAIAGVYLIVLASLD